MQLQSKVCCAIKDHEQRVKVLGPGSQGMEGSLNAVTSVVGITPQK